MRGYVSEDTMLDVLFLNEIVCSLYCYQHHYALFYALLLSALRYVESVYVGLLLLTRICCPQIYGTRPALFEGGGASPRSGP